MYSFLFHMFILYLITDPFFLLFGLGTFFSGEKELRL